MLKSAFSFLAYSNIFIAIAAVCQTALYLNIHQAELNKELLAFTFFSTIIVYLFAVGYPSKQNLNDNNNRIAWQSRNTRVVHLLMLTSIIACIILINYLDHKIEIISIAVFALLYNVRFKSIKFYGFRSMPLIKIISIALVWVMVCNVYPLMIAEIEINALEISRIVLKFFWIIALTIPFDIRDIYEDEQQKLITIPSLIGNSNAYRLSYIMFITISIGHFLILGFTSESIMVLISSLIAILIIYKIKNKKSDLDYLIKLDGLLILQLLIFYFINILN
jgi:4-hydroxybenzoate polyprenyltransferase